MTEQKKPSKFKQFVTNHPDVVIYGAATAIVGSMYAYLVVNANKAAKAAVKAHNEYVDKVDSLIAQADADGKATYLLADWTFLLVPKETPVDWIQDITKL
ncbi:hypothetical protein SEA_INKED_39 [Arthrobacter phage Inked]|jgi:hypothetical protein|nr:hypothetical protein SEA_INKED_39 [Arthrobacter phage Inked]